LVKKQILKNVSASFLPGEFNMILGPNGSGKSSFLKIFSGEINKFHGTVLYGDKKIKELRKEELAKKESSDESTGRSWFSLIGRRGGDDGSVSPFYF
jgi:ABC-type cobalamin/Fe3+-siderophores transport system ATPase subunit